MRYHGVGSKIALVIYSYCVYCIRPVASGAFSKKNLQRSKDNIFKY